MCRSFYEVQIIAPPSARQQLAKMGESIKLTLGDDPEITDGSWEEPFDEFREQKRGRAFGMPSAEPERLRGAGSNFDRAGEQTTRLRLT